MNTCSIPAQRSSTSERFAALSNDVPKQETARRTYYDDAYLRATAQLEEGGEAYVFRHGNAVIPLVVRPLPGHEDGFDVTTPYDYSGPRLGGEDAGNVWRSFCAWAADRRVVTGFFRFHPYDDDVSKWRGLKQFDLVHTADHVSIDLTNGDAMLASFKRRVPRDLSVARRSQLTVSIEPFGASTVDVFIDLYAQTMERCQAAAFYRFPRTFFEQLAHELGDRFAIATARSSRAIEAAALILFDGPVAFYYLSCTSEKGKRACATNMLIHDTALELSRMDLKRFHLGGGARSLLDFKERFGPARWPLFIGRAVCDETRYAELSRGCPTGFFPAYRAKAS